MAFTKPDVIVLENKLPDVFPEGLELYGRRPVTSSYRKELLGLAKKVWENDKEIHPVYAIALVKVKESKSGRSLSFSGVSEAYRLHHNTR